jgi:Tfp pilus assembly protein PilF/thiol-disulfide isomerase/thioredoxin
VASVDDGREFDLARPDNPTLIILWAGWCEPCLSELKSFSTSAARQEMQRAGVDLLAVNVDRQDDPLEEMRQRARADAEQIGVTFPVAIGSLDLIEAIDVVLRTLVTTREPLTLPTSILVDAEGRLVAVYRGMASLEQVVTDAGQLAARRSNRQLGDPRDVAVPFAGRWFTNPPPVDLLAVPTKLMQIDRTQIAFEYLERHVKPLWDNDSLSDSGPMVKELLKEQVSQAYFDVAIGFAEGKGVARDLTTTENALKFAIYVSPDHWSSLGTLASLYSQSGRDRLAVPVFRRMLQLRPNELSIANNLAWILATTVDDALHDPVTALALAKKVCERSNYSVASALDTLSVAHAANAEFDSAIEVAEKALAVLESEKDSATADRINERIELFRNRQAFRLLQ